MQTLFFKLILSRLMTLFPVRLERMLIKIAVVHTRNGIQISTRDEAGNRSGGVGWLRLRCILKFFVLVTFLPSSGKRLFYNCHLRLPSTSMCRTLGCPFSKYVVLLSIKKYFGVSKSIECQMVEP